MKNIIKVIISILVVGIFSNIFSQNNPTVDDVEKRIAKTNASFHFNILGGYGFAKGSKVSCSGGEKLQPYNLGSGVRAEYVFESKLSLGISFISHKGETITITEQNQTRHTLKTRMQYQGIEIGYWKQLNKTYSMQYRIGIGIGEQKGNFLPGYDYASEPNNMIAVSTGLRPYISPAISIIADINNLFYLGLEINSLAIIQYQNAIVNTFITLGIKI